MAVKAPTGRLLGSLVRAACAVPALTLSLAWLLAAASVWYAVNNLGLATSTRALLPQGLSYVERFVEYDREFGELDDLIIVVEARSLPEATAFLAKAAAEHRVPLLCGVTGLGPEEIAALEAASEVVPVLWSRNLSQGIPQIARLVRELADALRAWDVEIVETHHRGKREAPSGTALILAEAVAAGREQGLDDHAVYGRFGESPRAQDEIGIHALRAGAAPGEHAVLFAGADEEIRLTHRALGRRAFATGAVEAAIALVGAQTGLKRT